MEDSHAKKTLAALEAVIEGRASKDQESYTIAGRQLSRTPIPDLLLLLSTYERKVAREDRVGDGKTKRRGNLIRVRI